MAKESQLGGTSNNTINDVREGRDNVERSRQRHSSGSMNGVNSGPQEARGRGRGRTLPAWMTNKSADVTSASSDGGILGTSHSTTPQSAPNAPPPAISRDHERPPYQNLSRVGGSQQPRSTRMGKQGQSSSSQYEGRSTTLNTGRAAPATGGSDSSFGRGRGRTLPAWMTKQKGAGPGTNTPQATATQSYSQNAPGGQIGGMPGEQQSRGRGKDRTLPSWLTKDSY